MIGASAESCLTVAPRSENGRQLGAQEKIALFRRLFAGRPDVFALRWENRKDGRSGYAPACHNEWVVGVCGKPKIKCARALIKRLSRPRCGSVAFSVDV